MSKHRFRKPTRSPVKSTIEKREIECMLCRAKATARVASGRFGPYAVTWLQPPPEWWVLLANDGVHCRCSTCIGGSTDGQG